ncbi:flagellar hook capping FlgD N-terminal domain-containing protein [Paenibacillus shunpengii]|uniref:Flagellar hook capping FlgD N-terminal domain-containing protein n=1 Tax=Paenibacillus shunpengii TaxID=2054424 RepID=A0ABW5SK14_9BACL|nr:MULTISPECIES: flagellar hook capping FlgD N-terminal domain-containing protein [unclassified Paenibacillus]OMC71009.1 flagellar hook capping protein [Paenibacillus sp. FSL H7-0326]SDW16252.1 flagellar basal-body rod modification protein FlgD [Paenibacillus sp. PDC88]
MADIISTSNVWPNYSAGNVAAASRKSTQEMGKDQFLKILITQLQNQNPMQPMEDKEFIAQMAQFTSVEQLTNISGQLESLAQSLGAASGLIGKNVSWIGKDAESGESGVLTGQVESIIIRDQIQYAMIGDEEVALTDIIQISDPAPAEGEEVQQPDAELADEESSEDQSGTQV